MGNTDSTVTYIRDSTNINIMVYAVKKSGPNELLASTNSGGLAVQEALPNTEFTQSYIGELSGDIILDPKKTYLKESQKIIVSATYQLPTPALALPKYQGFGHLVIRDEDRCTSIQLCLESISINQTTAYAIYYGYLERCFDITKCDKVSFDVHATFFITAGNSTIITPP
jgi:hypothetical protein